MVDAPSVQRAWTVVRRGKPADALVLQSNWPVPQKLKKGEVLIKVQAGALNPVSVPVFLLWWIDSNSVY